MISNVSVPLLGAVDTFVMGHLSEPKYLGAVALGATIFSFIYWGFGFLRMGTGGLTAQAFGSRNSDEVRACLARPVLIAAPVSLVLLLLQVPISFVAFSLFDASAAVEYLAKEYFFVRIWGAPATLLNFLLLGWFIGIQRARTALWHQLWMNGVNILLDLIFVIGLDWGVEGVALATVIAEYSALLFGLFLTRPILRSIGGRFLPERVLDADRIRRTTVLSADIFIRTICLVFAFSWFTAHGAKFGDTVLAANAVLLNFMTFMAHVLDGFAHSVEALGGSAIGARDRRAFCSYVRVSTFWAFMAAMMFSAVYLAGGGGVINLLTSIDGVRMEAREYLIWLVLMPLVAVFPYILDGVFLGATQGRTMRNAMIVSLGLYIGFGLASIPVWGNHGLWAAMFLFMGFRGVTLGVRYPALERSIGSHGRR